MEAGHLAAARHASLTVASTAAGWRVEGCCESWFVVSQRAFRMHGYAIRWPSEGVMIGNVRLGS